MVEPVESRNTVWMRIVGEELRRQYLLVAVGLDAAAAALVVVAVAIPFDGGDDVAAVVVVE